MSLPPPAREHVDARRLYILEPRGRNGRAYDDSTERFVDETRMGNTA